jgi:hypothetical protein
VHRLVAMTADELSRAVDLLTRQVGHWGAPRWRAGAARGPGTRADLLHALVQRLADLAADAERQPHRRVPRLDNDLALPDQLRVVAADLCAAGPPAPVLAAAAADVSAARHAL